VGIFDEQLWGTWVSVITAADVAVTVTCEAGLPADVTVALNERVGSKIASGSGVTGFLCTGQPQSETVRVRAERAPFKAGVAVLSGFLSVCVPDVGSCDSAILASQVVTIRNK